MPGSVLNTKNTLLSFNPHNAPSGRYHHHFTERKLRHTLPSALEHLISKQRTNMLVRDPKTTSTKAMSLTGLERQRLGEHRCRFHLLVRLQCEMGQTGMGLLQGTDARPVVEVMGK